MRRLVLFVLMIPSLVVGFAGLIAHYLVSTSPTIIVVIWGTALIAAEYYELGLWGRGALIILLGLYIWLKASNWLKRNAAANNVILAKYTFLQLSVTDRERVHAHAVKIINASGGKFTRFTEETSQYGWYALALAELGIPPALPDQHWCLVRNPYLAIFPRDPMLKAVSSFFRKRYDAHVEISPESTLFPTNNQS